MVGWVREVKYWWIWRAGRSNMIISHILMSKTGCWTSLWNSSGEIMHTSMGSLQLWEESGENPCPIAITEQNPTDLSSTKFPRWAEWKKSMFFHVISVTASLPREHWAVGWARSSKTLCVKYTQEPWPIVLSVNRSSTWDCNYKLAKRWAFPGWSCTSWPVALFSKAFANLLQNRCMMHLYHFHPNWQWLQAGLA